MCPYILTLPERFWRKVDTSGGPDACWPWIGALGSDDGRPMIKWHGKTIYAYRLALAAFLKRPVETIPTARHVVCNFPRCCNAKHLAPGTVAQNNADTARAGRARNGTTAQRLGHTKGTTDAARQERDTRPFDWRWAREEAQHREHIRACWAGR